jgi:hypothetical protein
MVSRTLLVILSISSLASGGCALFTPPEENTPNTTHHHVYQSSYDEVWRAVQKALANYPIRLNNIDQGIIETDTLKGDQVWNPPFAKSKQKISPRYMLKIKVAKGRIQNSESTRVTLLKKQSVTKDFFSGDVELASDGLEEKSIFYRIEREIKLEHSLRKAFERSQI